MIRSRIRRTLIICTNAVMRFGSTISTRRSTISAILDTAVRFIDLDVLATARNGKRTNPYRKRFGIFALVDRCVDTKIFCGKFNWIRRASRDLYVFTSRFGISHKAYQPICAMRIIVAVAYFILIP